MEKFKVKFLPDKKVIEVNKGEDLLSAAGFAGVHINSACSGEGVCGKCKVIIKKGSYKKGEITHILSKKEKSEGYALSCQVIVEDNLEVLVPPQSRVDMAIKSMPNLYTKTEEVSKGEAAAKEAFPLNPLVKKIYLELPKPDLNDKISDLERIYRELEAKLNVKNFSCNLSNLKMLGFLLRDSDWKITVSIAYKDNGYEIISIEPEDTSARNYGLAFDIGTTTVSGQLLDLNKGEVLGTKATYNRQISFGDDVITRIIFASEKDGLEKLHNAIIENINEIIYELTKEHNVAYGEILAINFSGNTTMMHLLLGIDPTFIRREPYTATSNFFSPIRAGELSLSINPRGYVYIVPGVASYVGGDIVAGAFSTGLSDAGELSLLIDIGTNGEVVLGCNEWMISSAASAGPAFEGSGMSSGIRAMRGAIERIDIKDKGKKIIFKTIGDAKPIGICGSGYIDIVAKFLKEGIISKNGKINAEYLDPKRVRVNSGVKEIVIAPKGELSQDKDIVITENDIENLKRSKGAIYSAVSTLAKKLKLDLDDIKKIFIAGGFGTSLDIESAIFIGLLPDLAREKFLFVGNSSLVGSRQVLFSADARRKSHLVAGEISYLELSTEPLYMDEYIKSLFFPHTEMERFKSLKG